MGQQPSKSSIEARVIFQRVGAMDVYQKMEGSSSPAPVVRIQRKVDCHLVCPGRALEKSATHSWSQSRCDTGGLVYVMDNPTGGVWVKPNEKWTRS